MKINNTIQVLFLFVLFITFSTDIPPLHFFAIDMVHDQEMYSILSHIKN